METASNVARPGTPGTRAASPKRSQARLAEARTAVRRMRLVAAHPAIDFVNTQSGPSHAEPEDDALTGYAELLAWAEYAGILRAAEVERLSAISDERAPSSDEVLTRALELRAALHAIFEAIADRGLQPAAALDLVAAAERDALARAVLAPRGTIFDWSWPDADDLALPLWLVIHAATELLRTGPLDRLKECGACRFLFLDESKNRSRRWCAMSDCGAASKMRSYVKRRAERRASLRRAPDERPPGGSAG